MPRIDRATKRRSMKEQLVLLQRAVKNMEKHGREEFSRGYELGGMAMKRAIKQARNETGHDCSDHPNAPCTGPGNP